MQRAITKSTKKQRAIGIISAAAGAALAAVTPLSAATLTWVGTTADPNSATYTATTQGQAAGFTSGQNLYLWNNSATGNNWSGASQYTVGDNVIFTDNFAGGKDIRISSGNLNPATMTFSHIATGSTPATYKFTNSSAPGDFTDAAAAIVSANTPFGSGATTVLTLDTGFLGTVVLRARSNAANTNGNTIIRGGILEISDGGALPHNGNQNQPPVTLDGGEFRVKVNTQGNVNPAAGQLGGTLTVLSNSTISNGETTRTAVNLGASVWNGPVSLPAGVTLTLKSYTDVRLNLTNMNISNALGTIRLADDDGILYGTDGVANTTVVGVSNATSHDALGALIDLGTGSSEIMSTIAAGANPVQFDWGALTGGANTKITGSFNAGASTSLFSIGARGDSTTYAGIFQNNLTNVAGIVALTKVGTGTLTLAGNSTHTGVTTVNAGTLTLAGTAGALSGSAVAVNSNATFRVDNTTNNNADRLGGATGVTLNQGNMVFVGNLPAATAEAAGTLTIAGGANTVQTQAAGVGGPASISFTSLARTGGVVTFQPAAGVNINFGTAPSTNGIIGGFATVNGNDWAALDGSNNVVAYGGYTTDTAPGTWTAAQNINKTAAGAAAVAANTNINSLRLANGSVSIAGGSALNLGTGGLLVAGVTNPTISGPGSLTAGAGAAELITTVVDAGNTLTISAPIADNGTGAVKLVKAGPGKLFLSGSGSTYTGGTELVGGTLQVGVANFFPAGSNLTVNYGTAFDIGGFNQSFGTVAVIDGSVLNSGGAASVSAATAYDVRNGTISAALSGAAALTKTSAAGTVTLTGANTYTGGTTVSSGTLVAGAANTLPAGGALTVNGGGTLNIGAFNQSVGAVILGNTTTNAGTITGTSGFITGTSWDLQNGTVSANIAGANGVTKAGVNTTVTLSGASTYTGPTTIVQSANSGTLAITSIANGGVASAIGASSNAASNLVLGGGSTLSYTGTGGSTDRLFSLVNGNATVANNGTGPISFTNTGTLVSNFGNLTLSGSNTGANTFAPKLSQSDPGNAGALIKSGGGTWVLTNNTSDFISPVTFSGGILSVAFLANSGSPSPIGAGGDATMVLNNGTLRYTGTGHSTNRQLTLNNNGTLEASGTGPVTFSNSSNVAGPGTALTLTLSGTNTGANTLAPNIVGASLLTKTGAGTWNVTGTSTYTGATLVNGGTLRLHRNQTSTASVTVTGADAKLEMVNDGTFMRVLKAPTVAITSGGRVDLKNNKLITTTTAVGTANASGVYNGLQGLVQTAYNFGSWDQPGLMTSEPNAGPLIGTTTIGVTDASTILFIAPTETGTFAGQTVTGSSAIAMYTYAGDLNFDGLVDAADYGVIDNWVQFPGTRGYSNGDFNYDGVIDAGDYGIIDNTIQLQGAPIPVTGAVAGSGDGGLSGVTAVPEPASLSVLGVAAASLLSRRRRRQQ